MTRSILVTEIFTKATKAHIAIGDDSVALTLMSTDIERIRVGFRSLHETWASMIQAALAAWMLYNRLGVVFVAPIGLVIVCFTGLGILINFTGDSQRAWMSGVQKRVGLTATVIASMKNLKISGLSAAVSSFVQKLRVKELAAGARFRKMFITAAILGFIPQLIGPPLTFAFTQQTLDSSTMFTSLGFLTLLTLPLSQIFEAVPQLVSGLACLGRIQAFLDCETRHDFRQVLADIRRNAEKAPADTEASSDSALVIKNGNFGWEAGKFVLRNVNTRVSKSSVTIVVGPIGSGKSTLCMLIVAHTVRRRFVVFGIPQECQGGKRWSCIFMKRLEASGILEPHLVGEPFEHQHGNSMGLAHEAGDEVGAISDGSRELSLLLEEFSS